MVVYVFFVFLPTSTSLVQMVFCRRLSEIYLTLLHPSEHYYAGTTVRCKLNATREVVFSHV